MRKSRRETVGLGLLILLGGCHDAGPEGRTRTLRELAGLLAPPPIRFEASRDTAQARPVPARRADARELRIYYDLTAYEWYRRGQPLIFRAGSYLPEGKPQAIPAERLRRLGQYGGVDFYHAEGSAPDEMVYVPVFEGYWQPFVTRHAGSVSAD